MMPLSPINILASCGNSINVVFASSPSIILQNGTAGTSTIYTNNTSAKVSVEAPLLDYVDNNVSDIDGSSDIGTHSNFENQKDSDSVYDTITEENTGVITKIGTDASGSGNNFTLSFSHTLVSGTDRIVIVSVGVENGNTTYVSTVTYGGVTMMLAVERITGTSGFRYLGEIWYILENDLPGDGLQTVEINCSGIAYEFEINSFCSEYTGVTQGPPEVPEYLPSVTTATESSSPISLMSHVTITISLIPGPPLGPSKRITMTSPRWIFSFTRALMAASALW